jgi:hypothetical protein
VDEFSVSNLMPNSVMRIFTMKFSEKTIRIQLSHDLPLSVLLLFCLCLILKVFWTTLRQIDCITKYVQTYEYLFDLQNCVNFFGLNNSNAMK